VTRIEQEGRNVEEAIAKALEQLGIRSEEAEIEILDEGSKGVLNLMGAKTAKVRVSMKDSVRVEKVTKDLLQKMGFSNVIHVEGNQGIYYLTIETVGADGLLIGVRGETLGALQHIVNRIVNFGKENKIQAILDISGYRARREEMLRKKALALAERVRSTGKEVITDSLHSQDRRVIHQTLNNDPEVRTYTVGDGLARNVVIALRKQKRPALETRPIRER